MTHIPTPAANCVASFLLETRGILWLCPAADPSIPWLWADWVQTIPRELVRHAEMVFRARAGLREPRPVLVVLPLSVREDPVAGETVSLLEREGESRGIILALVPGTGNATGTPSGNNREVTGQ